MASEYERELRYLLAGKRDVVEKMVDRIARGDPEAALKLRRVLQNPFFVLRSAGSLGIDLVAMRGEISFPIEVKTSNDDVVRMSRTKRAKEQARQLVEMCFEAGLVPLYAYRRRDLRNRDPWRVFMLPDEDLHDRYDEGDPSAPISGLLYRKLKGNCRADVTDEGNYVLRWRDGWPLYEFVDYVMDFVEARQRRTPTPAAGTDPA